MSIQARMQGQTIPKTFMQTLNVLSVCSYMYAVIFPIELLSNNFPYINTWETKFDFTVN